MIKDTSAQDRIVEKKGFWDSKRLTQLGLAAIALVVLVFSVNALSNWLDSDLTVDGKDVRTGVVERGSFVRDINAQGRVVAAIRPTYYSPSAGTVTLAVRAGDTVEAGQVLATVDSPELQNELQQERSEYERLEVEVSRQKIQAKQTERLNKKTIDLAQVAFKAADRELGRSEAAFKVEAISAFDYEKAKDDRRTAELAFNHAREDARLARETQEFELQTAQLQLARQQLKLEEMQRRVDDLSIRSSVSGIVGQVSVEEKAVVAKNAPLVRVVDLSAFEIEIKVPENYADELVVGTEVEIRYNNQTYRGALGSVSPQVVASQVSGQVRFAEATPAGLRQNQRVTTRIILEERNEVLKVKRGAFLDDSLGRYAYLIEEGNAIKTAIDVGARSVNEVEIVSGLNEGDVIVVSNTSSFKKSDVVRITD